MRKITVFIFILCIVALAFAIKAVKSQSKNNRLAQLYIDKLRQCYHAAGQYEPRGICQYSLFDLDNDSVPELFVKTGNCEADYTLTMYGMRQDTLRKMFSTYAGHCDWLKGKGYIIRVEAQSGIFQTSKIALRKGKIKEEPLFFYNFFEKHEIIDLPKYEEPDLEFSNYDASRQVDDSVRVEILKYGK